MSNGKTFQPNHSTPSNGTTFAAINASTEGRSQIVALDADAGNVCGKFGMCLED